MRSFCSALAFYRDQLSYTLQRYTVQKFALPGSLLYTRGVTSFCIFVVHAVRALREKERVAQRNEKKEGRVNFSFASACNVPRRPVFFFFLSKELSLSATPP